ncbi:MAG: cytochrome c peroxidase [Planctomycetota bacterium]
MSSDQLWRTLPAVTLAALLAVLGSRFDFASGIARAEIAEDRPAPLTLGIDELRAAYAGPPETWPAFVVDAGVEAVELGLVPQVEHPADNPYSEDKAELGEQLFFDPRLSRSNQMSCASCHDPDLGWADGRTVSFGTDRLELARNAPTALGSGHFDRLFWDGRADSLEDLTLKVIANADEMHGVGKQVAAKIGAIPEYRQAFIDAFEDEMAFDDNDEPVAEPVTLERIGQAVATFVRTIEPGRSRFDRFVRRAGATGDTSSFTDDELWGLHLYRTEANCMNCHHGPMMTDGQTHVTGLHLYTRRDDYDPGAFAVTGNDEDRGAYKTPHLRHIARTGPYMHHGLFESLEVAVRAYNGGNRVGRPRGKYLDDPAFPVMSPLIHELDLSEAQVQQIVSFLRTLSEPHRRVEPPDLPPGLYGRE